MRTDSVVTCNMASTSGQTTIHLTADELLQRNYNIQKKILAVLPKDIVHKHGLKNLPGAIEVQEAVTMSLVTSPFGDADPVVQLKVRWNVKSVINSLNI